MPVTKRLVGFDPNQVPRNKDLGSLAFQDAASVKVQNIEATGVATAAAGSVSTPSITTTGDTNTGIFFPAADTVAATTGGTERMRIDSSGNVGIGTSSPATKLHIFSAFTADYGNIHLADSTSATTGVGGAISFGGYRTTTSAGATFAKIAGIKENSTGGNEAGALTFTTNTGSAYAERMRITSAGEVLVGGTTAIASVTGLTVQRTDSPPTFSIYRNDTTISSGDHLGQILFYGNDTTSNTPTNLAYIRSTASGTHAAGDNPTDLVFGTTPDNTETVAEAGRITQSGAYVLKGGTTTAADGVGIVFPATQVASANANCLDDYEEGTWTPTPTGWTSITYAIQQAGYTKIGNQVTAWFYIQFSGTSGASNVTITGLPFSANTNYRGGAMTYYDVALDETTGVLAYPTLTSITLYADNDSAVIVKSNGNVTNKYLVGSVTYQVA